MEATGSSQTGGAQNWDAAILSRLDSVNGMAVEQQKRALALLHRLVLPQPAVTPKGEESAKVADDFQSRANMYISDIEGCLSAISEVFNQLGA